MDRDTLDVLVSCIAIVFTVSFAWPQVVRALRHGVEGVSVSAILQSLLSASAWFGYGVATRQPAVMISDVGVVSGQLIVTYLLVRDGALGRKAGMAAVVGSVGIIALAQVALLTTVLVLAAGIVGLSSAATQLFEVRREPHKLEGLSAGAYSLLAGVAASWLAYGMLRNDLVIILPNLVMLPMALYISFTAAMSHRGPERGSGERAEGPSPAATRRQ